MFGRSGRCERYLIEKKTKAICLNNDSHECAMRNCLFFFFALFAMHAISMCDLDSRICVTRATCLRLRHGNCRCRIDRNCRIESKSSPSNQPDFLFLEILAIPRIWELRCTRDECESATKRSAARRFRFESSISATTALKMTVTCKTMKKEGYIRFLCSNVVKH